MGFTDSVKLLIILIVVYTFSVIALAVVRSPLFYYRILGYRQPPKDPAEIEHKKPTIRERIKAKIMSKLFKFPNAL